MEELLDYIDELEKNEYFYARKKQYTVKELVDELVKSSKTARYELDHEN